MKTNVTLEQTLENAKFVSKQFLSSASSAMV